MTLAVGYTHAARSARVCFAAAVSMISITGNAAPAQERVPRVLLLYPYDNTHGASTISGEAARRRLIERLNQKIEFHIDFLDLLRFPTETHRQRTAQYLAEKYAQSRIDVIITLNTESHRFASAYRGTFAPRVPVVFCCVTRALIDATTDRPSDIT